MNLHDAITELVERWASRNEAALSEPVAYSGRELDRYSNELHQFIIDSWLSADPSADIAITNQGGIRANGKLAMPFVGQHLRAELPPNFVILLQTIEICGTQLVHMP